MFKLFFPNKINKLSVFLLFFFPKEELATKKHQNLYQKSIKILYATFVFLLFWGQVYYEKINQIKYIEKKVT